MGSINKQGTATHVRHCRSIIRCIATLRGYTSGSLNMTELFLLCTLLDEGVPIRFATLADQLDTTVTTIARTCKRLGQQMVYDRNKRWVDVGLGLIVTRPYPQNTRELTAELSALGYKVMEDAMGCGTD